MTWVVWEGLAPQEVGVTLEAMETHVQGDSAISVDSNIVVNSSNTISDM